jgi:hypothetical protein
VLKGELKMGYYMITGMNEGKEIKPYYVQSYGTPHDDLNVYGDASRSCKEVSRYDYLHYLSTEKKQRFLDELDAQLKYGVIDMNKYIELLKARILK